MILALLGTTLGALPAGSLYDERLKWTDDSGARVELSAFRGRPVVLTMFYSDCATTCSITLGKLREIEAAFDERGIAGEFVLVSYDTSFDTPQILARFRERHRLPPGRWHLLTGTSKGVRTLAKRIGLGDYRNLGEHIQHSFRIILLDENGVPRKELDPFHTKVSRLFDPS